MTRWVAVLWLAGISVAAQDSKPAPAPSAQAQNDAAGTKKADADVDPRKPEAPPEKPFAELIKDARLIGGLFNLYQTEEKVYLELRPEQLGRMYMVSLTCESGIGERGFYAAQMCGERTVVFERQATFT